MWVHMVVCACELGSYYSTCCKQTCHLVLFCMWSRDAQLVTACDKSQVYRPDAIRDMLH